MSWTCTIKSFSCFISGAPGDTGSTGFTGEDGIAGTDGIKGLQGTDGTKGMQPRQSSTASIKNYDKERYLAKRTSKQMNEIVEIG